MIACDIVEELFEMANNLAIVAHCRAYPLKDLR